MRREELCHLRLKDMQSREGLMRFRIRGKRDKIRFVPIHPMVLRLIGEYFKAGKHGGEQERKSIEEALFSRVVNNRTGRLDRSLDPGSFYRKIVMTYAKATAISGEEGIGVRQR